MCVATGMTARRVMAHQDSALFLRPEMGQFSPHFGAKLRNKPGEKRKKSTGENSKNPMETAPRNCRFLSLVVVARVLIFVASKLDIFPLKRSVFGVHIGPFWGEPPTVLCWRPSIGVRGRFDYRSIQIDYRQRLFLGEIIFQLQIQNRAARRINCHYRDRSVGISTENLSLQIQILS